MVTVSDPARTPEAVISEFEVMRQVILTRDYDGLVDLHDPEFQGAELPGNLITAEEHIQTTMNSRKLAMEFFDLSARIYGDIALSWGKQTLHGELEPTDPGTNQDVAAAVADEGVYWSMLVVWRHGGDRWRLLSYQVTLLPNPTDGAMANNG